MTCFTFPGITVRSGIFLCLEKDGLGKEDIYAIQPENEKPYYEFLADLLKEEVPVVSPELTAFQEEKQPDKVVEQHDRKRQTGRFPSISTSSACG